MPVYNEETLSSVLGWVSIGAWSVVSLPQLYENYRAKSGGGLSMGFITLWLLGDVLSFIGAIIGKLILTTIALGIFYSICDIGLILQVLYYRRYPKFDQISNRSSETFAYSSLSQKTSPKPSYIRRFYPYGLGLLFLASVGIIAYIINLKTRRNTVGSSPSTDSFDWKIQLIGWGSTALFVIGRLFQIIKNMKTKCEGLSLLFFFFALWGNGTYVASLLVEETDKNYLIENSSWIAGGVLTMLCDLIILSQFIYYQKGSDKLATWAANTETGILIPVETCTLESSH